jgi:hypothetical protein
MLNKQEQSIVIKKYKQLTDLEKQMKIIKLQVEEQKQLILEKMEENDLKKLTLTDGENILNITYVAPQERKTIDTAKVKDLLGEETPYKTTKAKASVRIGVK